MNEITDYNLAKTIMGLNFIGPEELGKMGTMKLLISNTIPMITYSREVLEQKAKDYILILGASKFADGTSVTIRSLQGRFGKDPEIKEPCFYNQDWYDFEEFIDVPMADGWFLIRKNVFEESRAVQPQVLMQKYAFPSAICCAYAFFTAWLVLDIKLWYSDFVWCRDTDHNGDRIYVGKYHDVDGINKNGFSIHRHLALRPCYGCVD